MTSLELTLLYLLAAVLGVVLCRLIRLPPILGYLTVVVVIGPNMLALAQDSHAVRQLAEFGVVFLMFVIGLEFNLSKLRAMRRHVFGLGASQVILTVVLATAGTIVLAALLPRYWHMGWQTALALSGALAMSSTAIVVKLMADRLELESEHGQRVMGVLLFQDLAVVPLLVLIPALGSPPEALLREIGYALGKAALLITVLLVGGQRLMRWWLTLVARRKSEELFVLNVLLVTLGLAWLTESAGLSLALGAFIAGILISETEYKHQVEADIRPFHDVLLGLFFITIGMLLDWRPVVQRWPLVLLLSTVPVAFKLLTVTGLARLFGATNVRNSGRTQEVGAAGRRNGRHGLNHEHPPRDFPTAAPSRRGGVGPVSLVDPPVGAASRRASGRNRHLEHPPPHAQGAGAGEGPTAGTPPRARTMPPATSAPAITVSTTPATVTASRKSSVCTAVQ